MSHDFSAKVRVRGRHRQFRERRVRVADFSVREVCFEELKALLLVRLLRLVALQRLAVLAEADVPEAVLGGTELREAVLRDDLLEHAPVALPRVLQNRKTIHVIKTRQYLVGCFCGLEKNNT